MHMNRPERFLITWELIVACTPDTIVDTYYDMAELGINKLPYPLTDISIPTSISMDEVNRLKAGDTRAFVFGHPNQPNAWNCEVTFRFRDEECYQIIVSNPSGSQWIIGSNGTIKSKDYLRDAETYKHCLVVLLAVKAVIKTRVKDKLAALGIGKNKTTRAIYTTTLSLPIQFQSSANRHDVNGLSLRPHLRRGHIRRQRHGPKLEFIKKIWIEPCFVNSDEEYVSQRFSYNVSQREARP